LSIQQKNQMRRDELWATGGGLVEKEPLQPTHTDERNRKIKTKVREIKEKGEGVKEIKSR